MKRRSFLASAAFKAIVLTVALGATTVTSTGAVAALTSAQQSAADLLAQHLQAAVEAAVVKAVHDGNGLPVSVAEDARTALFAALGGNEDALVQNVALAAAIENLKNSSVLAALPSLDLFPIGGEDSLSKGFRDAQQMVLTRALDKVLADAGPGASPKDIQRLMSEQITISGANRMVIYNVLNMVAMDDRNPAAQSVAVSLGNSLGVIFSDEVLNAALPTGSNNGGLSQSQPGGQEATTTTYVP